MIAFVIILCLRLNRLTQRISSAVLVQQDMLTFWHSIVLSNFLLSIYYSAESEVIILIAKRKIEMRIQKMYIVKQSAPHRFIFCITNLSQNPVRKMQNPYSILANENDDIYI